MTAHRLVGRPVLASSLLKAHYELAPNADLIQ